MGALHRAVPAADHPHRRGDEHADTYPSAGGDVRAVDTGQQPDGHPDRYGHPHRYGYGDGD